MKHVMTKNLYALSAVVALGGSALTVPAPADAEVSGNIGVVSNYVLRGITAAMENDGTAVQGGLDWAHASGVYAGYWGSSLSYADASGDPDAPYAESGFENDLYAGYAGSVGDFSYDVGAIYYHYMSIDDADAPELAASVGWGPVSLGAKYLLDDVVWGNEGDTYLTLSGGTPLPADFEFSATLGYYLYTDEGEFISATENDSAFRHLDLTLSHPIGETGADMSVTYVLGGEDRQGNEQEDTVVLGVSYGFDAM